MPATFVLQVNGQTQSVTVEPETPLLYVLRNDLQLNGAEVRLRAARNAAPAPCSSTAAEQRSCVLPVSVAAKGRITTIEGLGTVERPHPLQRAFIEEQACQCGYLRQRHGDRGQGAARRANRSPTEAADQARAERAPVPLRFAQPHRARGHARRAEERWHDARPPRLSRAASS